MSFEAMAWAVNFEDLDPVEKFTLIMLANYASDEMDCCISLKSIAKNTNMSEEMVKKQIKSLVKKGIILVDNLDV